MKSVPSLLFFKPMKEEPPEWVQVFGWSIFTPDGHISGRGVDKGLPCEMAFKLPYRPGEKCLDKSTGRVVTIVSCEPVRVEDVTIADAEATRVVAAWDSLSANQQEHLKEKYMRDAIGEDDLFYLLWHKRHPGKEWAWRVEGEGVRE